MSRTENIDAAELAKFEELASRWWDPDSEFKPLHDINPLRTAFINERTPVNGKRLLDVGCGGGILAESMATLGAQVTAIDIGKAPLAVGRLHLRESGLSVHYELATAERYAQSHAGGFDIVTCLELLEHVPDPASTVAACASLVRPGGSVYFSTINRNAKAWLFAIIGAEYMLRLLPRGTHEYRKLIRPSELERWCRAAGLGVREMTGMHYNPLSRSYWLGPGVDVNYLLHSVMSGE